MLRAQWGPEGLSVYSGVGTGQGGGAMGGS